MTRRAKYFILHLSDHSLLIHLRMSGDLFLKESKIKPEKHDRLILSLLPVQTEEGVSNLVHETVSPQRHAEGPATGGGDASRV